MCRGDCRQVSRCSDVLRIALVAVMLGLFPGVAVAHAELDYTDPTDGDLLDGPVTRVVVAFTSPVETIGSSFEALDPDGELRVPEVESDGGQVFTLTFDTPLEGGEVGVRYQVSAEDGHVISGGFAFTVGASAAETTTTSPTPSTTLLSEDESTTTEPFPVTTGTVPEGAAADQDVSAGVWWAMSAAVIIGGVLTWIVRSRTGSGT